MSALEELAEALLEGRVSIRDGHVSVAPRVGRSEIPPDRTWAKTEPLVAKQIPKQEPTPMALAIFITMSMATVAAAVLFVLKAVIG